MGLAKIHLTSVMPAKRVFVYAKPLAPLNASADVLPGLVKSICFSLQYMFSKLFDTGGNIRMVILTGFTRYKSLTAIDAAANNLAPTVTRPACSHALTYAAGCNSSPVITVNCTLSRSFDTRE